MNTHAEYRRHSYQPAEPPQPTEATASELAHHRDPSLAATATTAARDSKGIAWVRPTEMASYVGPMVGRGIDLQAELVRRARRTPVSASRAIRPSGPEVAAPPATPTRQEGLQL